MRRHCQKPQRLRGLRSFLQGPFALLFQAISLPTACCGALGSRTMSVVRRARRLHRLYHPRTQTTSRVYSRMSRYAEISPHPPSLERTRRARRTAAPTGGVDPNRSRQAGSRKMHRRPNQSLSSSAACGCFCSSRCKVEESQRIMRVNRFRAPSDSGVVRATGPPSASGAGAADSRNCVY